MPSTTVEFNGICTYVAFDQFAPERPAYGRRIVLPNGNPLAIANNPHLNGQAYSAPGIEAHYARLSVPMSSMITGPAAPLFYTQPLAENRLFLNLNTVGMDPWLPSQPPVIGLQGATLRFASTFNAPPLSEASGWCLPHLSTSLEAPAHPSPVITNKDTMQVSAYFDMEHGTLVGVKTEHGQAITHFNVSTEEAAQIVISPWDGGETTTVSLIDDPEVAKVVLINEPYEAGMDSERDFLLHFVVTNGEWPPKNATGIGAYLNTGSSCPPGSSFIHWEAGPGCSNSNIP